MPNADHTKRSNNSVGLVLNGLTAALGIPRLWRRGSVRIVAGVSIVPLRASAGAAGLDMARLSLPRSALQAAVDEAALAGAAAYQSDTQSGTGTTAAMTRFNRDIAAIGGLVTINSVTATPSVGKNAQGYPSFNVSVSVTATMNYSLMTVMNLKTATVTASQPRAFMLVSMRLGVGGPAASGGSSDLYGAAPGNLEVVSTAPLSLGQGPAQNTNAKPAIIQQLTDALNMQPASP